MFESSARLFRAALVVLATAVCLVAAGGACVGFGARPAGVVIMILAVPCAVVGFLLGVTAARKSGAQVDQIVREASQRRD